MVIRPVAFILLVTAFPAVASVENLDEVVARKTRLGSAVWGSSYLEDSTRYFTWQPETLAYSDSFTGTEVWRLTYMPFGKNVTQDISSTHWSANGNRVAFASNRRNAARPSATTQDFTWFITKSDGSQLRPGYSLSNSNFNWSNYPGWNPAIPDLFYLPGNGTLNSNYNTLYANSISDSSISIRAVVDVDNSVVRRLNLKKGLAGDGSRLFFSDLGRFVGFVADLKSNSLVTPSTGYSMNLQLDSYWGNSAASTPYNTWHDNYVTGGLNTSDGIWNYFLQANTSSWWRARLTGRGANNSAVHIPDHTLPYDWGGELEPVNTVGSSATRLNDPWGLTEYISHFAPDRWGRYGIFTKSTNFPYGTSLIDFTTHGYWNGAKAFSGANVPWVQHHDWEAWADWSVSSGSSALGSDYSIHRITTQNYRNPNSQKLVCFTHSLLNSGGAYSGDYYTLPRPTQSPDGTKIMFNSTFLNATDNDVQLFWAVAYYPSPPEIKNVISNGSNIDLVWDFNQGASCSSNSQRSTRSGPVPNFSTPRTYATRGWPDQSYDCPPSPREVDVFRVWMSEDNSIWKPIGTTTYNNCRGGNECGMWAETVWTYNVPQPLNSTRYYAVTSVEYSGLESRKLSNVWKVTLKADGTIKEQREQTKYPDNPGGKSPFYRISPPAISSQYGYKISPATADGQYIIKWRAPSDPSLASFIRYYNIYAKDGSLPFTEATPIADRQKSRIASIPASATVNSSGEYIYLDWVGATDGSTRYIVTAVDYQGNESLEGPGATRLQWDRENSGPDNTAQGGN